MKRMSKVQYEINKAATRWSRKHNVLPPNRVEQSKRRYRRDKTAIQSNDN